MEHKILIYADFICPFCYIGKGIVEKLKEEFHIEDEWLPFKIHTETPKQGIDMSRGIPGFDMEKVFTHLNDVGTQYGIELKEPAILSNSHLVLQAGEYAKEKGKFQEFHSKVVLAYFMEGKDLGDIEVVSSIAEAVGLNVEELLKKLEEGCYEDTLSRVNQVAKEQGIDTTPTFIIDNKYVVVGDQPIEAVREALLKSEAETDSEVTNI